MTIDLKPAIVRILNPNGATVGTGFIVTDDTLIATCAHVVSTAGAGPGDKVRVVFHATGEEREVRVEPEWWRDPDAEDVAILRLEGPLPEGVTPLDLGAAEGSASHPFRAFGYPVVGDIEGLWATGEIKGIVRDAQGRQMLQLASAEIDRGISGGPVLDETRRRVVGMVTATYYPDGTTKHRDTGFATSTETLQAVCPELQLSDLCPYRGLAAFTEADAEFFFGREALVADLVDHLRGNPRFLAVVGPSGSGKSSVVRAGLFPALHRGEVPCSADWHLLSFRPGADPFAALTTAGLDVPRNGDLSAAIRAFLETHPQVKRLVLFADQFEELFTLCPQPVQEQFLRQLAALLEGNLFVTLVLTLRADFYGHLLRYRPLVDWLKIGQVNVPPMGPEELRAAVEKPALGLGLRFEPGLVETIVEEAGEAEHPLPLLESTLTQLWENREDGVLTHAAYQAVGRVAGAIGQWAEDTYSGLTPEEQSLARRVFTRLVRYGEGEAADTRQRRSLSELMARPEEQETLHRLVHRLADARLLVTGGEPDVETVEIIHDALLQEWGRLRQWVTGQREFYLWRQRLDERLQEWEGKGQDEGALLRGALLAEAERWLAERSDDLNLDERKYIRESVALRVREQAAREQLRRRITLGLAGGLFIALVLAAAAGLGWQSSATNENDLEAEVAVRKTAQANAEDAQSTSEARRQETEEQRQVALARQLAAQAELVRGQQDTFLVRSLLLAVESLQRHRTLEGYLAWSNGMALLPPLVAQMAHDDSVFAMALSPDGRWIVSGGQDRTARVWEAATGAEVARMTHEETIETVAFSPDGELIASGGRDKTIRVWETTTGREIARMGHEDGVQAAVFSPDGRWVVSGSSDKTARVWEAATGREVARMTHEAPVYAVAFSPDAHWVVSGYGGWDVESGAVIWEVSTGREVAKMPHEGKVNIVAFSPDGQWVVSGGRDKTARVWEAATGRLVARLEHGDVVNSVAFSPDGQWIASGYGYDRETEDSGVVIWDIATRQPVTLMSHQWGVNAVAFSPDGQWVLSGSDDDTARVWEAATGREVARMPHNSGVHFVSFSSDGQWLVSGDEHKMVRVWDFATGQAIARIEHNGPVNAVAFSPDGRWVVSGYGRQRRESGAIVWDVVTGREVIRMNHDNVVEAVAFSPNGQWVVSGGQDQELRVWEVSTGQEVSRKTYGSWVRAAAFSPDGRWVTSVSQGGWVRVWEAATGEDIVRMKHGVRVNAVAFSPDGHWVASGGSDKTARVWEVATGREVTRIEHEEWVNAVAFSPEGQWVVSGSSDHVVRVWKATTGEVIGQMIHEGIVNAVAFSPDGQWVVSGSSDTTVRVWEVVTGQEVARMTHEAVHPMDPPGSVNAVAFSPDGRWVVSGSEDRTVRVWSWRTEDLLAEACARLPRNLTREEWRMYLGDESYRPTCPNLLVPGE